MRKMSGGLGRGASPTQLFSFSRISGSRVKIRVLFYFELGGITKHLMIDLTGNSEFCFPENINVPRGETKLTVSRGASH